MLLRIQDPDFLAEAQADQLHGPEKIRVIRDQHRHVNPVLVRITYEMRRKIDVGAFLLGLDDPNEARAPGQRVREWHRHFVAEVVPEVNFDLGQCGQSAKVQLLARLLPGTIGTLADMRGEVLDALHVVFREQQLTHRFEVQPAIRRALEAAVIKVERININVCAQRTYGLEKQKPPRGGLAPCAEATGGI